jgi:hypothetical protein
LDYFFAAQLAGFHDCFSLHPFGQERGTGYGGNAALGEKSDFRDAAIGNSQGKFQNIATGRVLDLGGGVGIHYCSRVAGVLEVIEDLGRVH